MNDHEAVAKGAQAEQALLVLEPAMDKVREAILAEMIATSPQQSDRVLALHAAAQAVEATRAVIKAVISDGQVAAHALSQNFPAN